MLWARGIASAGRSRSFDSEVNSHARVGAPRFRNDVTGRWPSTSKLSTSDLNDLPEMVNSESTNCSADSRRRIGNRGRPVLSLQQLCLISPRLENQPGNMFQVIAIRN